MLTPTTIRPAAEADEATIRSMVRAARLVPTNLHWSRFLVAEEEGGRIVGMRQVKVHKGGTREVASGMVLPEYQRRGVSARLMRALLDHEQGPLYLRCKEKWARYYERFGFRRVEPSELPADFRKDYRIGTIIVAIRFLFARRKPRFIPMKRDGYRARPMRDGLGTLRQPGHAPPLGPKTGVTRTVTKKGDRIALDERLPDGHVRGREGAPGPPRSPKRGAFSNRKPATRDGQVHTQTNPKEVTTCT